MVTICMIAMLVGVGLFLYAGNFNEKSGKVRGAGALLFLGGIIGGCFGTPSRGMPNGMPGAVAISVLVVVAGIDILVTSFAPKSGKEPTKEQKQMAKKVLIIVAVVVVLVVIALALPSSPSSSHSVGGPSGEPWRDLGVSKKEYMDVYNYYKYGNP